MNDTERQDAIDRAASYLSAMRMPDGRWAYWAHETLSRWIVTTEDLLILEAYITLRGVNPETYSSWCAATPDAEETVSVRGTFRGPFGRTQTCSDKAV